LNLPAKKYYLCALLLFAYTLTFSQTTLKTEEKELYFNIYYAYRVNDTMIVFIDGANNMGIKKGNLINAFQTYSSAKNAAGENRKFNTVGEGKIVKADRLSLIKRKIHLLRET
jgi:hypothetical protein